MDIAKLAQVRADETPPSATDVYSQAADYIGRSREHKARIARLDALARNQVDTVWPDGTVTQDVMKLAEYVTSDIDDLASLVAGPEPTIVVPQASDRPKDMEATTRLQQVLYTYRRVNRVKRLRRQTAIDLIGTGLACWVVWPNYGADPSTSYPQYMRRDPRTVFPDPSLSDPSQLSSLVVSYTTKTRLLVATYPELKSELFTSREDPNTSTENVQVIEFYDRDWCVKIAHRPAKDRRFNPRSVTIAAIRNTLGTPMALVAARETQDGQFRGQFDTALEPLATANKMMELHLAQMSDSIYAEKLVRGLWDNPEDIGPGATLYTTDYQANIDRAATANSSPQMYQDLQLLLNQSREAAGVPAARHGDISQNIASAQFVNAIQGKYITLVSTYQELIADLEERANSVALKVDRGYMEWPDKVLAGVAGGRSFAGSYTPSLDIIGVDNRVVYGAGSGLDSYNRRIANIQDMQYGLISRRTARAQLDTVEDVVAMEAEIFKEQLVDGFVAGIAAPETDLATRAKALALAADGKNAEEIAAIINQEQQAQAAQMQMQQAAAEAMMGGGQMQGQMQAQPGLAQAGGLPALPNINVRR